MSTSIELSHSSRAQCQQRNARVTWTGLTWTEPAGGGACSKVWGPPLPQSAPAHCALQVVTTGCWHAEPTVAGALSRLQCNSAEAWRSHAGMCSQELSELQPLASSKYSGCGLMLQELQ